ncbi:sugar ABC transporter ATP-binding protein [Thermopolyspora flexuosa]|uniref:Simple sugar transport system ATP-binding protein n=1 Tax=Thermopolyspora flexuosa TaxID=103836 RepID=A0A543IWN4_9ACTN|nr:sugar ABC transporter ATP-binding protein [Thermopolyspora flexuosa]TQM74994.1 simple sugar transport system ATP-binding protein [Thermopolyspora flexuosa]GGM92915.1 sugar ABC transporter ATP-binding protein [Thermopolyspora flexuosa]
MTEPEPIVRMRGIGKHFPGVKALDGVDFRLLPGEVHALMGENGAGKSTLIKVLTGVHPADEGEIELAGRPVAFSSPLAAQRAGISTVYQEINLCPNLSVAENIFAGRQRRRFGLIRWRELRRRAAELMARLDIDVDVSAPLSAYSPAVQQMVAIARALDIDARVLVLDEPTSSLDAGEVERLFRVMRRLRDEGIAILFVSHFLDQVYAIADRMTILRDGRLVGEYRTSELSQVELVAKMVGRDIERPAAPARARRGPETNGNGNGNGRAARPLVEAEGLGRSGAINPFTLTIPEGEVVGLAGLLGSGRTELARLLFGADHADTGTVRVGGETVHLRSPRAAIRHRIAFCPENRRADGLVDDLSVRENIVLAMQAARGWSRPLPRRRQDELVERFIAALDIRPADPDRPVRTLSGGNQQKVLLARWLIMEPRLLILDEPTRGIDVGAKAEIERLVAELSAQGMSVLFISAELEEVLRLSHRVGVLRDRTLVARLDNDESLTTDALMRAIASGAAS